MLASQGIVRRKWTFQFSDDVDYIPQAPTTGFSGIPGVGDLPSQPTQPVQPVLTLNTRSVDNTANANFSHSLGPATSLSAGGSYAILRFPDGNGLEDNQWQVNGQITRRSERAQFGFCAIRLFPLHLSLIHHRHGHSIRALRLHAHVEPAVQDERLHGTGVG
jgi:hypothetical protein